MANKKSILVLMKIFKGDTNPFDEAALEIALSMKDYDVSILSMAPSSYIPTLTNLTRLGCKAYLVSDHLYALSDTVATSKVLSKAIDLLKPDIVFTGRQSIDGDTGQVPYMISELTGYGIIRNIIKVQETSLYSKDGTINELKDNKIVIFEKIAMLRSPSIFSSTKEVKILTNEDLLLSSEDVGEKGSLTKVIKTSINSDDRRFAKMVAYSELDSIISSELKKNKTIQQKHISKAPLIHYVGDIKETALNYAIKAERLPIEQLDVKRCVEVIEEIKPKIILWEETPAIKELASRVAIATNNGLCADVIKVTYENNQVIFTRPAFNKDVLADIVCTSSISMATVRKDNQSDDVAFVIGRGAIDSIENIKKLADKYHAKVYCSRPLADEGIMDYSNQVGLTGTIISPRICVDIGTSGAIQHIAGINKSKTIVAININKDEKIFDYADYGIVMDAKNI